MVFLRQRAHGHLVQFPGFTDFPQANQVNDAGTQWYLQGNSRLGAKVKADKVTGQIELATTASSTDSAGDGAVNTRRAYGSWKFSDNAYLKVGKDYSPVTDFISNQWYDGDNDLLGNGILRPASAGSRRYREL